MYTRVVIGLILLTRQPVHFFIFFSVIFLLFFAGCSKDEETGKSGEEPKVSHQLVPTLSIQQNNESIYFLFAIENKSNHTVSLNFPNAKMFDITVTDASGKQHYQYSKGKNYDQKSKKVQIKAKTSHLWKAEWNVLSNERQAGIYKVEARLTPNDISPGSLEMEDVSITETMTLQSGTEKLQNNSFRNITVSGEDGTYTVTGEARVFEAVFAYAVSDGHNVFVEQHKQVKEGAPSWSPFTLEINIPESDLPINGTLMLELFYFSPKDGAKTDLLPVPLQTFR
jgi:hypothetical protein